MGRIRTHNIKDTVKSLLEKFPEKFTDSFDKNKEAINEFAISQSKRHRNKLAGYMARRVRNRAKRPHA